LVFCFRNALALGVPDEHVVYTKLLCGWDDDDDRFVRKLKQQSVGRHVNLLGLEHWNNSPRVDMSIYSDTYRDSELSYHLLYSTKLCA